MNLRPLIPVGFVFAVLSLIPDQLTIAQEPEKNLPPPRVVEPARDKAPVPPDLAALVAKPPSEARALARHYDADRGALRRKYPIPTAPSQYGRSRTFCQT